MCIFIAMRKHENCLFVFFLQIQWGKHFSPLSARQTSDLSRNEKTKTIRDYIMMSRVKSYLSYFVMHSSSSCRRLCHRLFVIPKTVYRTYYRVARGIEGEEKNPPGLTLHPFPRPVATTTHQGIPDDRGIIRVCHVYGSNKII